MLKSNLPAKLIVRQPVKNQSAMNLKKYFLKDPNADLFINLSSKIFPVHRSQLISIPYFQHIPKTEKIHIINQPLNTQIFENVLGFYYAEQIVIETLQQLEDYLIICQMLQITIIPQLIQKKLLTKPFISQIEIFILLQIAFSYSLVDVFKYCMAMLENQQFQQINYNKFDFMYVDFKLFQIVIRRHHRLKNIQNCIKGLDQDVIEESIILYCKLHKMNSQIQKKLLKKYVNIDTKAKSNQNNLTNLLRGPTLSSQKDNSSAKHVQNIPHTNQIDEWDENNQLKIPQLTDRKKRKYSDGIQIFKVETSTDEGTKIYGSGKLKDRIKSPLLEEIKIKQQTQQDNLFIQEIQSPQIRINNIKQNTPRFQDDVIQKDKIYDRNQRQKSQGFNLINVQCTKSPSQKLSKLSADPDQFIDKITQILDHYKSAYQLHESNMFSLKKRFGDGQIMDIDMDRDRRFSAGPADAPYRKDALGRISARLTNTVDMVNQNRPFKHQNK